MTRHDVFRAIRCLPMLALAVSSAFCVAEDWPAYRHDNHRSGMTAEAVDVAALKEQWVYVAPHPPQPAWHGPAKWDAFAGINDLRSMRNYDPAFFVITIGERVYFGSSSEDAVYCLDAATGAVKWRFDTDGPVRMPPAFDQGKLYFGADDGCAYCLNAEDGAVIWKFKPPSEDCFLPNDGKLISRYPCRTGVLVEDGTAYCAMALLPWEKAYLCALDAATGTVEGPGRYCKSLEGVTMEGALLASPTRLYVPQGRTAPLVFNRADGAPMGVVDKAGGVFALLTPDLQLVAGPSSQKEALLAINNPETKDRIATFERGNFMIVTADRAYVLKDDELTAVNRGDGKTLWTVACACPYTLILAGNTLLAGGNNEVTAFNAEDGKTLATLPAQGRAYGLAVANTRLYISTDTGAIHCWK